MTNENASEEATAEAVSPTLWRRLVHEVRTHPFGYAVLLVGIFLGPVLAVMIFPDAPPAAAAAGGLAFGVYAALSSVPQKFL